MGHICAKWRHHEGSLPLICSSIGRTGLSERQPLIGLRRRTREQVALVDDLALALLQLGAQPPQLRLVLAQQRALVPVLVHRSPSLRTALARCANFSVLTVSAQRG